MVEATSAPVRGQQWMGAWRSVGRVAALLATLSGTGCGTVTSVKNEFFGGGGNDSGEPQRLTGFIGAALADEPRAALLGRDILATGGTAADAAAAMGFMLAVTLPSRAGLGGGGACLAYSPDRNGPGGGNPEAILFTPVASSTAAPGTDRPASVPMLARGLFALQARYGRRPFETLISPAEQAARFGVTVSRALLDDLAVVAGPLIQDPNARAVFAPGGQPLTQGSTLSQPELGATLSQLRTAGVGDLYIGQLARRVADASRAAGGGLTVDEMRGALPRTSPPLTVRSGSDFVAFTPPPADGGLAAAAAFQALMGGADARTAQARALSVAARWRQGGGDPTAVLASGGAGGTLSSLPASTGWLVLDRDGNSVACVATMDNLFGTGRIAPGTGILLAAAPRPDTAPLLAAALAWNPNLHAFRAAVTGTGQDGAALAAAAAMFNALHSRTAMPTPVPEPGRANAIGCSRYLPDSDDTCTWAVDPRSAGLAASGG